MVSSSPFEIWQSKRTVLPLSQLFEIIAIKFDNSSLRPLCFQKVMFMAIIKKTKDLTYACRCFKTFWIFTCHVFKFWYWHNDFGFSVFIQNILRFYWKKGVICLETASKITPNSKIKSSFIFIFLNCKHFNF